eukprot:Em0019g1175a
MAFGYRSSLLDCICGPSDVRSIPREADTFPFSSRRAVLNYLRTDFIEAVHSWGVQKTASPFNRRVTCIEWHPAYHNLLAVSSHGGDIYLWNVDDPSKDVFLEGIGYGYGAITQLKFHPYTPTKVYTTSVDGKFCLRDLEGKRSEVYADTMTFERWWTSLALSANSRDIMFVGGNTGDALVLDAEGVVQRTYKRLHKDKIQHAEFCPTCEWLLVTSSNDRTVALWDVRAMGDGGPTRPTPLATMVHDAPINSAHFDPLHGSRILTTAQNSELRVYDSYNGWEVPTVVMRHPHRHFQHMTHIKASWHPIYEDLCMVGRYPEAGDADKTRCVDLVDLRDGTVVGSFYDPSVKGIIPVNVFNHHGNRLASGTGCTALLWQLRLSDESTCVGGFSDGLPRGILPGQSRSKGSGRPRQSNQKRKQGGKASEQCVKKMRGCPKKH